MSKNSLLLVLAIVLGGCAEESYPEVKNEMQESDLKYSFAIIEAEEEAKKRVALMIVEEAVQGYRLLNSEKRFPKDLNEIVSKGMMVSLPELPSGMLFAYDPETGEVTVLSLKNDE